ncbi:glycosyltransferase family 2 protein [Carnobacterium maltaromaticum]|uniref:glycosyltransferase family 2 protein n=1 Tax=Carnobacterium maltaromaticum TaxID=2751 RepID=UPI0012FBAC9C|nr:glycosyltransferase [Carnobacterium maltaromaticum]
MKVSIIIPVYNGERTIKRAIDSCLNQTYLDFEVLIMDNQSTDETNKIVTSINDDRIYYYQLPKKGRALARNEGLKKASGDYIQFLDADDVLLGNKLEESILFLEENRKFSAYCHGIEYRSESNTVLKVIFPKYNFSNELFAHNIFPIHSLTFRSTIAKKFPEDMDYCEDWLFWVNTLDKEMIYFNVTTIGGIVYVHEENTMSKTALMSEYELYVQQILKSRISVTNFSLLKNEISLLIIHYFNLEKEQITIGAIKNNSNILYKLVSILCKIPIAKNYLRSKVDDIIQKDIYNKGENHER